MLERIGRLKTEVAPTWWPWLIGLGAAWGLLLTGLTAIADPTPENLTLAASIWSAAGYTLGLRATRRWWLPWLVKRPVRNAILLSIFNAGVIETEFLLFEKLFGAAGIAAHPNLIVDLLMTLPWYSLMALTFFRVHDRWRFSTATLLCLGGVYELGFDGILAPFMGVLFGSFELFTLNYWIMLALTAFWGFIAVYSSLMLPPAWVIATTEASAPPDTPVWRAMLKPLVWLIPYVAYLSLLLGVLAVLQGHGR
jgi:hypothetical protein